MNPSKGNLELVKTFGGSKNDVAKSVISTVDGGLLFSATHKV